MVRRGNGDNDDDDAEEEGRENRSRSTHTIKLLPQKLISARNASERGRERERRDDTYVK